jgi:hypothetical protein
MAHVHRCLENSRAITHPALPFWRKERRKGAGHLPRLPTFLGDEEKDTIANNVNGIKDFEIMARGTKEAAMTLRLPRFWKKSRSITHLSLVFERQRRRQIMELSKFRFGGSEESSHSS